MAAEFAGDEGISWVSTDAECVVLKGLGKRGDARERVECVSSVRAPMIGADGLAALARAGSPMPLALDANYVRRRTRKFSGRNAAHGRRDEARAGGRTIRAFLPADAAAVTRF